MTSALTLITHHAQLCSAASDDIVVFMFGNLTYCDHTALILCVSVCVLLHTDKCKSKYISKSVTVIVEVPRTTCLPLCVSDAGPSELSPTRLLFVGSRN